MFPCHIASRRRFGYDAMEIEATSRGTSMAGGHKAEGGHPAMDYAEHDRTYEGFIRFSVIGTIWCLVIIVGLAIGATGKSWGWGSFMIFAGTVAGMIGIFMKSIDHKAVMGVFVLSLLVWAAKALH
jgi:Bacterial aa3 type cytochrome c oxidase subunit IV